MNIAILIGVSKHIHSKNDLPACKNDVMVMSEILNKSGKFADLLVISENEPSSTIKGRISNYLAEKSKQSIDEVLFYFSGHGIFDGNDFYFVLPEFEEGRRRQTCLENTELDTFLKNLKAKLTVKIVDACYSGQSYIKDPSAYEKFISKSQSGFESCYFLFSSLINQTSKANASFSCFSKAIFEFIFSANQKELRYKDLIDYLSDVSLPDQTPFFVTQAKFSEIFLDVNSEIKALLEPFFKTPQQTIPTKPNFNLIELVKADSERYLKKEKANELIIQCKSIFENFKHSSEIASVYTITNNFEKEYESLPKKMAIGQWVSKSKEAVFAKPTYTGEEYYKEEAIDHRFWPVMHQITDPTPTKQVKKWRKVVEGFYSSTEMPIKAIEILFSPKFENLTQFSIFCVVLLSKTHLFLFTTCCKYFDLNWDKKALDEDIDWNLKEFEMIKGDEIKDCIENSLKMYEGFILEDLKRKVNLKTT